MLDPASSAYWPVESVQFKGVIPDVSVAYTEVIYNFADYEAWWTKQWWRQYTNHDVLYKAPI